MIHWASVQLNVQHPQIWNYTSLNLINYWLDHRRLQTKVVLDILPTMTRSISKVGHPQCLHGAIFRHQNATAALCSKICVYRDGINIDSAISWCHRRGWNSHCRDICDGRLHGHRPVVLVEAKEHNILALLDVLLAELRALNVRLHQLRIILDDCEVLQWVHEQNLARNLYRVRNGNVNVAHVVWHDGARNDYQTFLGVNDQTVASLATSREAI